ncbi:MAG TPA: group III truncated hemoglobin [Devosia sp.]|nr:group III truncated hemoglobin [Devosia sp.]
MSTPPSGPRLHPTGRLIPDGLDEAMVRAVVDDFYGKARRDDVIGPIFNRVIAEADWPHHLDKITSFWSSMLLGAGTYNGRPMPKHIVIDDLADPHFVRWLALFRETVEHLCPPDVARLFIDRAERVAQSLRLGLAQYRGLDTLSVMPLRAGEV